MRVQVVALACGHYSRGGIDTGSFCRLRQTACRVGGF
jgi:hypothetical protein